MKQSIVLLAALLLAAPSMQAQRHLPPGNPPGLTNCVPEPPKLFATYDLNGDETITSDEFASVAATRVQNRQAAILTQYDSDGDGAISADESKAVAENAAAEWLTDFLDKNDKNQDGAISSADFPRVRRGTHPLLARLLKQYDTDADGILTAAELTAIAEDMATKMQEKLAKEFDTNSDGTISSEELNAVIKTHVDAEISAFLNRYDGNDDGSVTLEEFTAARPLFRPGMR